MEHEQEKSFTPAFVDVTTPSATKFSIMAVCKPTKLFVHAVFLVLALIFFNEVIQAFIRYQEGKLGISTKEMKSKYVKYPSVAWTWTQRKKILGSKG